MGSKIEKFGEDFFRPVNKAVKRSGLAGILPYASMALPFLGLPGGAFTRYLLPQLMTSASSVAEGGRLNPLRNLTTAGASYLAGPTANRPGGADPFDLKANVMDNPSRANYLKSGYAGSTKDPTMFQKFKAGIGDLGEQAKNYAQSGSILGEAEAGTLAEFTQPAKTVGTLVGADRSLNAYEAAKKAQRDYQNANPNDDGYNSAEYTSYLKEYLANAGYSQEEIDDYMANRPSYNMGGRVGLAFGGGPEDYEDEGQELPGELQDIDDYMGLKSFAGGPKSLLDPKEMQVASNSDDSFYQKMLELGIINDNVTVEDIEKSGIASLKMGGMPSMEMDYRGGGFIPVGSKEKADDVPARLSKNEFVMTADAVRAAGGGSVNEGAQRMYKLMNELEAKV